MSFHDQDLPNIDASGHIPSSAISILQVSTDPGAKDAVSPHI
jgi:hypothetical protein